jgi:glycosyltransferase involved in cell wall biosynthesis
MVTATRSPVVSVAMITFNHRQYIAQAIESVLSQRRNFEIEIVISDDCSPDGTGRIVDLYQAQHPQLFRRLDPMSNLGMHANFEQVWNACRGKYIAILEGDDWWHSSEKLAKQLEFMEKNDDCTVSGHHVNRLQSVSANFAATSLTDPDCELMSDITALIHKNYLATASMMFRRGVVNTLPRWFRTLPMGDWPLALLHALHGRVGYINESMATYRLHGGGVWSSKDLIEQYRKIVTMYETLRERFPRRYWRTFSLAISNVHRTCFFECRKVGRSLSARYHLLKSAIESVRTGNIRLDTVTRVPAWLLYPWSDELLRRATRRRVGKLNCVRS